MTVHITKLLLAETTDTHYINTLYNICLGDYPDFKNRFLKTHTSVSYTGTIGDKISLFELLNTIKNAMLEIYDTYTPLASHPTYLLLDYMYTNRTSNNAKEYIARYNIVSPYEDIPQTFECNANYTQDVREYK